ncbi:Rad54b [Symbiodinium sp. CCMP2456]|nr:Rad54b [Symbiodinium sp. CCMP2456]
MAQDVEFAVCGPAGQEIGKFHLNSSSRCVELKLQIEQKIGPPSATQQIIIGDRTLEDSDLLLVPGSSTDSVIVTLLLHLPQGVSELEARWTAPALAGGFMEELQVITVSETDTWATVTRRDWEFGGKDFNVVLPNSAIQSWGLDPESGMVLLVRSTRDLDERAPEDRGHGLSESEDDQDVKGMGKGLWRRRPFLGPASLIIVPSEGNPTEVQLDVDHPLHWTAEILAAEAMQGFPVPSLGIAVARVFIGFTKVHLISLELCPAAIKWQRLTAPSTTCEAVCLDRQNLRAIFVQRGLVGREVVFTRLRGDKPCEKVDQFPLLGGPSKMVSSIAWSSVSSSLLLTFVGEHAIRVYQKAGSVWQAAMTLGDPSRRGCADGEAGELMFWFPKCDNFDGKLTYSRPLIAGPSGTVFVHSGGVLMRLSDNLSSARKVTSMREELWMLDTDEGTPFFPDAYDVAGVHDDKVYRALRQNDFRGRLLVRRLQVTPDLRQDRGRIRETAPALWPSINENRVNDAAFVDDAERYICQRALRPVRYYEEDRERWDGNPRWLSDGWLWCNTEIPKDVRVNSDGRLVDFTSWVDRKRHREWEEWTREWYEWQQWHEERNRRWQEEKLWAEGKGKGKGKRKSKGKGKGKGRVYDEDDAAYEAWYRQYKEEEEAWYVPLNPGSARFQRYQRLFEAECRKISASST